MLYGESIGIIERLDRDHIGVILPYSLLNPQEVGGM